MNFFDTTNMINLVTLTGLEIILGVDNVIFIALIVQNLPDQIKNKIRIIGLSLALIMRIGLLFAANWIIHLTEPFFEVAGFALSGRNLMLIVGGSFLIFKTISEIRSLFDKNSHTEYTTKTYSITKAITQIIFVDLILSFDSIITAVGVSSNLSVIILAIFISMIVMLISSKSIGSFIETHPNIKVVALCFIGLVGGFLLLNGLDIEVPKAYLYFAVFFSIIVETINIILTKSKSIK